LTPSAYRPDRYQVDVNWAQAMHGPFDCEQRLLIMKGVPTDLAAGGRHLNLGFCMTRLWMIYENYFSSFK
jgi:hypothetical protein